MTCSEDNQLVLAEKLVKAGDFRRARQIAKEIGFSQKSSPEHRAKAMQILKTTGIDPVAIGFFALTFGCIVFLFFKYVI